MESETNGSYEVIPYSRYLSFGKQDLGCGQYPQALKSSEPMPFLNISILGACE